VRFAYLLALAACGRLGFDPHRDANDAAPDVAPGTPLTTTLPDGGQIDFINVSLAHPWYAVSHAGAAFRSDDHMTWVACGARFTTQISALDTGVVYAGGADTAVSMDNCATWMPLGAGQFTEGVGNHNSVIYALLDTGLRTWNGSAWTTVTTPLDGARFKSFSAFAGSVFLIGTGNGLLHSGNGVTWTAVTSLPSLNVVDVAASTMHTYAISAASGASNGAISCSDGAATTWSTCSTIGGTAVAVDPTNDLHAFAAIYDNLLETTDAFQSAQFDQRGGAMGYAVVHDVRFNVDGTTIATTDRGIYVTAHNTINWQPAFTGLSAWTVNDIAIAGDDVYIATTGGVLSGRRGQPYTHSFAGMSPNTINNATVVAPDGTIVSVGRHIWTSTDHGATWSMSMNIGSADGYRAFSALVDGTRVWAGTGNSIYVADAPYTTWTPHAIGHRVNALVRTGARLWAGTDVGVLASDDDGMTWQPSGTVSLFVDSLALLPDGSLAAGTVMGLAISDPTRTTWMTRSPGVVDVRHIAVAGDAIVVATPVGIYASHDQGVTWTPGASGDFNTVVIDSADGQLVIGTNGAGLLETPIP